MVERSRDEEEDELRMLPKRWEQLPLATRRWISKLRSEDIETLNEAIQFQEQARTVGKFGKWLLVTFAGALIFMYQFGHALSKIIAYFAGKGAGG